MFKRFFMLPLLASILILSGCVSMKKRPLRLWNEVVESKQTFDAIIVPGVPFENGTWSDVMRSRVLWSVFLYNQGITRNIIYSGSAVYTPYYEAKIMGLYAEQLGVPKDHIFYDTLAEHSTENVFYSYRIAQENHFKTIALATDPFQSSLLKRFTRKRFQSPIPHVPILYDSIIAIMAPRIDPKSAYVFPFTPITERESFWKRTKGTMGRYIPWENKKKKSTAL